MIRTTGFVSALLLALPALSHGSDAALDIRASVQAGTDYVFRGISQTQSGPALQASLDLEHKSGLYAGIWSSNVDFVPDGEPDDGARVEIDLTVGYGFEWRSDWFVDFSAVRYLFPSTHRHADYDYGEVITTISHASGVSVTAGWSNNVFGIGARGLALEFGVTRRGPFGTELSARSGLYDLSGEYNQHYRYFYAGITRSAGPLTLHMGYHRTDAAAESMFGIPAAAPRFVLGVEFADW